jgi:hypothetical protein
MLNGYNRVELYTTLFMASFLKNFFHERADGNPLGFPSASLVDESTGAPETL